MSGMRGRFWRWLGGVLLWFPPLAACALLFATANRGLQMTDRPPTS